MSKTFRTSMILLSILLLLLGLVLILWPTTSQRVICYALGVVCLIAGISRVVTQWKQLWELKSSCSSPPSTRSLRTILRSKGGWMSFSSMQATAQAPQPVHLRTSQ